MTLTQRELEVLRLLCLSDKDIAKRLIISIRTVKCHVHNILNELVCENRQKALIKALKLGVVTLNDIEVNDAQ